MLGWLRRQTMRTTMLSGIFPGSRLWVRFAYALWSTIYDWSVRLDPAYPGNARRMVERTVESGDRVLDVGTGTGLLAETGAALAREYVGLDYSGSMLSRAARKIARLRLGNVLLRWGDARELPWPEASFDAVISSFALPHFARDEREAVLAEMGRVLRPGGRLGLFLAQGEAASLFPTREELVQYLEAAGYADVAIEDRDHVYRIVRAVRPSAPRS